MECSLKNFKFVLKGWVRTRVGGRGVTTLVLPLPRHVLGNEKNQANKGRKSQQPPRTGHRNQETSVNLKDYGGILIRMECWERRGGRLVPKGSTSLQKVERRSPYATRKSASSWRSGQRYAKGKLWGKDEGGALPIKRQWGPRDLPKKAERRSGRGAFKVGRGELGALKNREVAGREAHGGHL